MFHGARPSTHRYPHSCTPVSLGPEKNLTGTRAQRGSEGSTSETTRKPPSTDTTDTTDTIHHTPHTTDGETVPTPVYDAQALSEREGDLYGPTPRGDVYSNNGPRQIYHVKQVRVPNVGENKEYFALPSFRVRTPPVSDRRGRPLDALQPRYVRGNGVVGPSGTRLPWTRFPYLTPPRGDLRTHVLLVPRVSWATRTQKISSPLPTVPGRPPEPRPTGPGGFSGYRNPKDLGSIPPPQLPDPVTQTRHRDYPGEKVRGKGRVLTRCDGSGR